MRVQAAYSHQILRVITRSLQGNTLENLWWGDADVTKPGGMPHLPSMSSGTPIILLFMSWRNTAS